LWIIHLGQKHKGCDVFLGNKFLQVIHLGRKTFYLFTWGFLLSFLRGKDFVKVFYWIFCVSHSIATKKIESLLFFLCALCIFRRIICEGFSKCKPFHLGWKNNAFLCFFITEIFAKVCHSFGMKIYSIGFYYQKFC
jgi:hypothetical protein